MIYTETQSQELKIQDCQNKHNVGYPHLSFFTGTYSNFCYIIFLYFNRKIPTIVESCMCVITE